MSAKLYNWGRSEGVNSTQEYYRNYFPVELIRDWAVNINKNDAEGASKQTYALFSNDKMIERYFTPQTNEEFVNALLRFNIERIEIGGRVNAEGQIISQRLAFDLDSGDYELVYPGEGVTVENDNLIKQGAWIMLVLSLGYLGLYLKHIYKLETSQGEPYLYVFSGRRGAHLWVEGFDRDWFNNASVRELSDTYIPLLRTASGAASAYDELCIEKYDLANWFAVVYDYAQAALESDFLWGRDPRFSHSLAGELSVLLGEAVKPTGEFFRTLVSNDQVPVSFWHKAGLLLLAPRHDRNVTTSSSHLLKSPFSIHPKTRLVAIPFNPFDTKNHERDNVCLPVNKLVIKSQVPQIMAEKKDLEELFNASCLFISEPEKPTISSTLKLYPGAEEESNKMEVDE